MKVSVAQNMGEPAESEKSLKEANPRSQIHELFFNKPSDSVTQSYQHDNIKDFEDEESLFEHLN